MTNVSTGVAPFPMEIFHSYGEFEAYLAATDSKRGLRWLHEQSLASTEDKVVLSGTCGLCLVPTKFTAMTRGGEQTAKGIVPNWREGLQCGCEYRLINRQRAVLHFLAAEGLLRAWTRILLVGEVQTLQPFLAAVSRHVVNAFGAVERPLDNVTPPRGGFHLILWIEQMRKEMALPELFAMIRDQLAPGGALVMTAPFDITKPDPRGGDRPEIGWGVLDALSKGGLRGGKVCTYWSEEFGYLGAFNLFIVAHRL